jgi:hypothetical protein
MLSRLTATPTRGTPRGDPPAAAPHHPRDHTGGLVTPLAGEFVSLLTQVGADLADDGKRSGGSA